MLPTTSLLLLFLTTAGADLAELFSQFGLNLKAADKHQLVSMQARASWKDCASN